MARLVVRTALSTIIDILLTLMLYRFDIRGLTAGALAYSLLPRDIFAAG